MVVLIGVLVALTLPSLGLVRDVARGAQARSDLRQHATVFAVYAGDSDERFPQFADSLATSTVLRGSFGAVELRYFSQFSYWPYALMDRYYAGLTINDGLFRSPYLGDWEVYDTPYLYSCSLVAVPEYWDPSTRTGRDQFRANRMSAVTFPGSKAVLSIDPWMIRWPPGGVIETHQTTDQTALLVATDGHAAKVRVGDLGPVVPTGDGNPLVFPEALGGHGVGWIASGAHTLHGVRGRDLP